MLVLPSMIELRRWLLAFLLIMSRRFILELAVFLATRLLICSIISTSVDVHDLRLAGFAPEHSLNSSENGEPKHAPVTFERAKETRVHPQRQERHQAGCRQARRFRLQGQRPLREGDPGVLR